MTDGASERSAHITGLGAVSPIGVGVRNMTAALRRGQSGVTTLELNDHERARIRSRVAAPCRTFDPDLVLSPADQKRLPRLVPMALAAAREALDQAGLTELIRDDEHGKLSRRIGVALGTGAGGIDFTLDQASIAFAPPRDDGSFRDPSLWTITNATHGNLVGELSIRLGLRGPSMCISDGCASSSDALGLALELLRSSRPGAPDAMLVIGADAHIRWEVLRGMELLGVISTRDPLNQNIPPCAVSRPFDALRDGFVLGEGAWAVLIERPTFRARAKLPDAPPIGRLLGYGVTCDAFHRVRPAPHVDDAVRAIHDAIADAQLTPDAVELVHYHGTGTQLNDVFETNTMKAAFGQHAHRLIGHSVKSMIGHPQGACGLASVVSTLAALTAADHHPDGPFSLPTINLDTPDDACDLMYTPLKARPTCARTALINCLAFGAKNSALVLHAEEHP